MSQSRSRAHVSGVAGSRSRSLSSSSSGRGAQAPKWDGETGYRIHVSPLNPRTSRRDLEKLFTKYGTINEVWMATNPPCFAFINFKHRSDAEDAVQALDGKMIDNSRVGISFARKRTIGGRRGAQYNGGGGERYGPPRGDYDASSRNRRRFSPRPEDDMRDNHPRNYDRRRRNSRSRSPIQHKREYRPRSKSPSPRGRRNQPSTRDRSPQQQAASIVHRYAEGDD